MATGYPYQPLEAAKDEIRLLCVKTDPFNDDEPLQFSMEHARFNDGEEPPDYIAVSYTWGDPTETDDILIDGRTISVPKNSEITLRNLIRAGVRLPLEEVNRSNSLGIGPSTSMLRFWIDAICINQADVRERGQQVSIMWRIFSQASLVLAWIGHDDGTTAAYVEQARRVIDHCRRRTDDFRNLQSKLWTDPLSKTRSRLVNPDIAPVDDWDCIESLFSSPWFLRLWVVQEVVLARKAYIVRGETILLWDEVRLVATWLEYLGYSGKYNSGRVMSGLDSTSWIDLFFTSAQSCSDMLSHMTMFDTTDPRDRVYGILGMLKRLKTRSDTATPDISPDYCSSPRLAYTKATRMAIELDDSLRMLAEPQVYADDVADESASDGFPSWVPRLHMTTSDKNGERLRSQIIRNSDFDSDSSNGFPLAQDEDSVNPFTLCIKGLVVDTIQDSTTIWLYNRAKETANIESAWKMAQAHDRPFESLIRVLTLDEANGQNIGERISQDEWKDWFQRRLDGWHDDSPRGWLGKQYRLCFEYAMWRRHFFVTENGFLGTGQDSIRAGDVVCILFGAGRPYILRPAQDQPGSFRLVGDAYVDGLMSGQYVGELQESGRLESTMQWIDII